MIQMNHNSYLNSNIILCSGGSVQVWWSNNDYTGSLYSSMGLIIEVGSYNGGTPIINNTTTLMGSN